MQKKYDYFNELFQKGFDKENQEYLERRKEKDKQATRPSALGKCQKRQYLDYFEVEYDKEYKQLYNEAVPLWAGNMMHDRFENWCKKGSTNLFTEKNVEWEGISGNTDLIAKPEGEYVIVDYKGKSGGAKGAYQRTYVDYKNGKLDNIVEKQLTFYASASNKTLGLDIKNCIILYYSRDLSYQFKFFLQPFKVRQKVVDANKKYIDEMKYYISKEIEPKPNPAMFYECSYNRGSEFVRCCPYLERCGGCKK